MFAVDPDSGGFVVAWELPESIGIQELAQAASDTGFPSAVIRKTREATALKHALAALFKCKRTLIRPVPGCAGAKYQVTREALDAIGLTYAREAIVCVNVAGELEAIPAEIQERVKPLYEQQLNECRRDLMRDIVARYIMLEQIDCMQFKRGCSVYFVPSRFEKQIDLLGAFLARCNGNIVKVPVDLCGSQTQDQLARIVTRYIVGLLHEWEEAIKKLSAHARDTTIASYVEDLLNIRDKILTYGNLLGTASNALLNAVESAAEDMKTIYGLTDKV